MRSELNGSGASDQWRAIKEDTGVNLRPPFEHTPAHTCTCTHAPHTCEYVYTHPCVQKQNVVI